MRDVETAPPEIAAAASIDGRHFQFVGTTESVFEPGGLVVLASPGEVQQLGQVEEVSFTVGGATHGTGRILSLLDGDGQHLDAHRSVPFASATLHPADARTTELLYGDTAATLPIGSFQSSRHIPARILAQRFNRHTFWCGQSGSGKTYALGVVLEQLLIHTALPMVIFDPNADFVQIRQAHPAGEGADAQQTLAARDIRVLRPSSPSPDALRVKFVDLSLRAKAAVFRLDPLDNRAEHNLLMHLEETVGLIKPSSIVPRLLAVGTPAARNLADRTGSPTTPRATACGSRPRAPTR